MAGQVAVEYVIPWLSIRHIATDERLSAAGCCKHAELATAVIAVRGLLQLSRCELFP
jgi:hypothetical protein